MDILIEFVFDLVFGVTIEASKSSKVPKPIRYILIIFLALFYLAVFGLMAFMGISICKDNLIGGLIILLFTLGLLILSIYKFKKEYNKRIEK